jgi:2C-methyl-D-erythritol 2,4-cyclodiphosphate synthase
LKIMALIATQCTAVNFLVGWGAAVILAKKRAWVGGVATGSIALIAEVVEKVYEKRNQKKATSLISLGCHAFAGAAINLGRGCLQCSFGDIVFFTILSALFSSLTKEMLAQSGLKRKKLDFGACTGISYSVPYEGPKYTEKEITTLFAKKFFSSSIGLPAGEWKESDFFGSRYEKTEEELKVLPRTDFMQGYTLTVGNQKWSIFCLAQALEMSERPLLEKAQQVCTIFLDNLKGAIGEGHFAKVLLSATCAVQEKTKDSKGQAVLLGLITRVDLSTQKAFCGFVSLGVCDLALRLPAQTIHELHSYKAQEEFVIGGVGNIDDWRGLTVGSVQLPMGSVLLPMTHGVYKNGQVWFDAQETMKGKTQKEATQALVDHAVTLAKQSANNNVEDYACAWVELG